MKIRPKIILLPLAVILFSFFNITCKDSGMNLFDKSFSITTEDVSCTEVWLKIKIGPGNYDREVILKRDTVVLFRRTINELETTIIDTNLLPNHTYTYTAQLLNNSETSNSTAQTMDTTSHNFTWQTFTLGDGTGSSCLYDVAIINDTLAYAVGQIYRNDTLFNAAKWNGQQWELKKISVNYKSNWITPPLDGIFAFSATDIWVVGSFPIHGDGNSWTLYHLQDMGLSVSVSKAWGTSSSSIYFVGLSGSIAYYNGSSWKKIESGTSLNINDIWGDINPATGQQDILCVASNYLSGFERGIIKITGTSAQLIGKDGIDHTLSSVWFKPSRKYFVAGDGMFEKNTLNTALWTKRSFSFTPWHIDKLRGRALNDIVTAGGGGEILHYNGMTWKSYYDETRLNSGNYYSIAIIGNMIIAVGENAPQAVILIGQK